MIDMVLFLCVCNLCIHNFYIHPQIGNEFHCNQKFKQTIFKYKEKLALNKKNCKRPYDKVSSCLYA